MRCHAAGHLCSPRGPSTSTGVSFLVVRIKPLYTHTLPANQIFHRTFFQLSIPVSSARVGTGAQISETFSDTLRPCAVSWLNFLGQRSPAILPALAAPRSSAACRRAGAGSDALLPAGASSTAHASPARRTGDTKSLCYLPGLPQPWQLISRMATSVFGGRT